MKKAILILAAATCVGSVAMAAPCVTTPPGNNILVGANGTLNQPGTADTYVPCTVGTATFSNVSYLLDEGSFTTPVPNVTMVTTTTSTGDVEIELNPNLGAGSDILLEFLVTDPGVSTVNLAFNATGNGFIDETVCTTFTPTGICTSQATGNSATKQLAGLVVTSQNPSATGSFTAQNAVWIIKDINTGNAPFSEFTQDYIGTATPEPAAMGLLGAGLLGLGLIRRRAGK